MRTLRSHDVNVEVFLLMLPYEILLQDCAGLSRHLSHSLRDKLQLYRFYWYMGFGDFT